MGQPRLTDPSAEPETVAQQYDELVLPRRGPRRRIYWTLMVAGLLLAAVAALWIYRATHRPFSPHDIPAMALLEESLSQWSIHALTVDATAVEQRLRTPDAKKLLGDDVSRSLLAVLAKGVAAAQAKPEDFGTSVAEFTHSQVVLNSSLAKKGLPLFVDGTFLPAGNRLLPLVMTYYVERDASFDYQGKPLRAIFAWRMDPMRVRLPALGYARDGNPVAIVSYDAVETTLVLHLLPSLVDKEPAFVFDEKTRFAGDPKVGEIEARLGAVLFRHYRAVRPSADLLRLGELLAARRNLIAKWRRSITGFSIKPPERLLPESDLGDRLSQFISRTDAARWEEISSDLEEPRVVVAFEHQRDELANAIQRHELQHLIDGETGLSGIPVVLARRLSVDPSTEPRPFTLFGAARAELSAYLAQLAEGPHPQLSLVQLASTVFDRTLGGQPHRYAALAIFDGLIASLQLAKDRPTVDDAVVRVIEADAGAVRAESRQLYEEWFGRALVSPRHTKTIENLHWRH